MIKIVDQDWVDGVKIPNLKTAPDFENPVLAHICWPQVNKSQLVS